MERGCCIPLKLDVDVIRLEVFRFHFESSLGYLLGIC